MQTLYTLWIYLFMLCLFYEGECLQVSTYGRYRYLFSTFRTTQAESQAYCRERSGNLTSIPSRDVNDFLTDQAAVYNQRGHEHYIGLQASSCSGVTDCRSKMRWIDGTSQAGYIDWTGSDEPTETCVVLLPDRREIKGLGCSFQPQYFICKLPSSACNGFSCLNGGQCFENPSSLIASCTCQDGFNGEHCQTEINECESSPCLEGYMCVDMLASYRCIELCQNSSCVNGGTCVMENDAVICECPAGFTGENCEILISTSTTSTPATPGTEKLTSNDKTEMLWFGYPYWYFVAGGGGLLVLIICTAIITSCATKRKRQAKRKSSEQELVGNQGVDNGYIYDVSSFYKGPALPDRPTQNAESACEYSYETESRRDRLDCIPHFTAPSPGSLLLVESNSYEIGIHDAPPEPSSTDTLGKFDLSIPESPIVTIGKPVPPIPESHTATVGKPVPPFPMSESSNNVKPALFPKPEPTDGNNQEDYMNIGEVGGPPKREVPEYISSSDVPERPPKPGNDIEADDQELYMNMVELSREAPPEREAPIYDSFPERPDRILEDDDDEQELYANVEKVVRRAVDEPVYDDLPESPESNNEPVYSPDSPESPECGNAEDEQDTYENVSSLDQRNTEDFLMDQGYNNDDR